MVKTIGLVCLGLLLVLPCGALGEQAQGTATIYADFSNGSVDPDALIKTVEIRYDGELTPKLLVDALTTETGLDFFINDATQREDGFGVDWSADSTLLKGLDDREQNPDYFMFDVESLNWFMLDSLWRTLTENLNVENVYYTMDGGMDLVVPEMSAQSVFPADLPYMGSGFFFAHEGVLGDDEYGELGYDDEVPIPSRLEFIETEIIPGLSDSPFEQVTSEGGYLRENATEDGIIDIMNRNFPFLAVASEIEQALENDALRSMNETMLSYMQDEYTIEIDGFSAAEDEAMSAKFGDPCFMTTWTAGANEDLREYKALFMMTDQATLMYRIGVSADFAEENARQIQRVFDGLTIGEVD